RKPLPWDLREITRAIDKFPLRRQEMLDQHPGR
ncbi:MAG TPA: methylmalonyl-CoA epimerase, partial [Gemmobacter sp.]|nr:methylmalonyl-CoA epimerase [Gemmobacter sp.]